MASFQISIFLRGSRYGSLSNTCGCHETREESAVAELAHVADLQSGSFADDVEHEDILVCVCTTVDGGAIGSGLRCI
jgi:hypothetical protein